MYSTQSHFKPSDPYYSLDPSLELEFQQALFNNFPYNFSPEPDPETPDSNAFISPTNLEFNDLFSDPPIPLINTEYTTSTIPNNNFITITPELEKEELTTLKPTPPIIATPIIKNTPEKHESIPKSEKNQYQLFSRLSLHSLSVLLNRSLEETIEIEKFILDIFVKELGFPLGYKTWIRDTNNSYRERILNELFIRVHPRYPYLSNVLLEAVVKRATYSVMQGRLRKERREAAKLKRRRNK